VNGPGSVSTVKRQEVLTPIQTVCRFREDIKGKIQNQRKAVCYIDTMRPATVINAKKVSDATPIVTRHVGHDDENDRLQPPST
jgi:hypothetical protein